MIAEGKYPGRGIEGALVIAQTGTEGVQVLVEITDGEHKGERLRWDSWLTDATAQRTIESLRHLGWKGEMLDDLTGITENEVQLVVEHETKDVNGEQKTFPRVKWINKPGGGAKIHDDARVVGAAAKALAQRFRALARGIPASGGAKAAAAPAKAAPRTTAPKHAPDAPDIDDSDLY